MHTRKHTHNAHREDLEDDYASNNEFKLANNVCGQLLCYQCGMVDLCHLAIRLHICILLLVASIVTEAFRTAEHKPNTLRTRTLTHSHSVYYMHTHTCAPRSAKQRTGISPRRSRIFRWRCTQKKQHTRSTHRERGWPPAERRRIR